MTELQAQSRLSRNKPAGADTDSDGLNGLALQNPDTQEIPGNAQKDTASYEYEVLKLDGLPYLCRLPHVEPPIASELNKTLSKQEEERELARANERGWELLQGMQGNCIYFWSGWWSYRYCFGEGVKQFHQLPQSQGVPAYPPVEDPGVGGYMLGRIEDAPKQAETGLQKSNTDEDSKSTKALGTLETRGETRYLVQRLGGGTECDLTGKPRRIEVQVRSTKPASSHLTLTRCTVPLQPSKLRPHITD